MRVICALLLTVGVGCRADEPKPAPIPPVRAIDARIADAPPADAAAAPPQTCDSSVRAFRFGTLAAPAGWCWRRTEEGDDQSGDLVDATGAPRARYTELSFDEKVGDPCLDDKSAHDVHEERAGKVHYRTCERAGRHCATFHGAANLCTPDAATLADLLRTLAPKP